MIHSISRTAAATALALATFAGTAYSQQTAVSTAVGKAEPVAKATVSDSASNRGKIAKAMPQARPLVVTVDLLSQTKIAGTLTDQSSLAMQTAFGTADIPLSEVAGIRFASADDPSTTVVMHNGDSVTGATDVKLVTIETEWGVATINGQSVRSILFVPDVAWNPASGLNGKRWTLTSVKKEAPKKPAAATQQPNQRTTTTTPAYQNRSRTYYRGR